MRVRNLFLLVTAVALAMPALARDLSVVSWGGAYQDAQKEVYFKPFQDKTKIKGGANNWDVVQVESEELLLGCEEGLYEKLDYAKLGGRDKFLKDAVND